MLIFINLFINNINLLHNHKWVNNLQQVKRKVKIQSLKPPLKRKVDIKNGQKVKLNKKPIMQSSSIKPLMIDLWPVFQNSESIFQYQVLLKNIKLSVVLLELYYKDYNKMVHLKEVKLIADKVFTIQLLLQLKNQSKLKKLERPQKYLKRNDLKFTTFILNVQIHSFF